MLIKKSTLYTQLTLLIYLIIYASNSCYGQILTANTELKREVSQFNFYPTNPCDNQNSTKWIGKKKIAHFLHFESCQEDKNKLKGTIYGVIVIDDTLYKVSIETANLYFYSNNEFLKCFKKLDDSERILLETTNLKLNRDYYNKLREDIREIEEKKRLEEEEKRRIEAEKRRLEIERIEKLREQEIANGIKKASSDSIINKELESKLIKFNQQLKSQDSLVDVTIKTGIKNGGILISKFNFSTSKYGVVDLTLGIQNVGKKRIKYVKFTLQPYNSVDDPVEYEQTFKGIGFIEPNSEGVWEFESAWYSNVIETLKLSSINILYEDGSSKLISKIGEIRIDDDNELFEAISNKQKKKINKIGSLTLLEYPDSEDHLFGLCFYSISDQELKIKISKKDEAKQLIKSLSEIIINYKAHTPVKYGDFEITRFSTQIYLYLEGGYCLITELEAEELLKKLNEIYPS
jgi:hypothetical protein